MIGLLAGVAVYALAGFLIAPRAIKLWIESPNVSGPSCRLRVRQVYVNPFTMFLSLENVTLLEQENKLLVSATRAETAVSTLARFRAGTPGRDVVFRNLVVTSAASDETILAVPQVFATNVTVGESGGFIVAAYARLEQPDAAISHDSAGIRYWPAWLSVPGRDPAGACISVDGFRSDGGRLRVHDFAVSPDVRLELRDVVAGARRSSDGSTATTQIDFSAHVGAAGSVSIAARLGRPSGHHPDSFSMTARNVDLHPISPYFRRVFGRDVVAGSADVTLRHERDDAALRVDNRISVTGLRLGEPTTDSAHEALPLALALATDAAGRSTFSIQGSVPESREQTVGRVFADSLSVRLDSLAARPFGVLAEVAGDTDTVLDEVAFLPGSAEMAPAATDTLALLAAALGSRPLLGMRVRPAYDPVADRDAIAAQQVRLHIALATSAGRREGDHPTDLDFDDPRVRDILDEFAGARLSDAQRRAIARDGGGETSLYRHIFHALVANERVSETLLRRLARFRARSVIDTLSSAGIDRNRFRITDALDTAATAAETVTLKVEVEPRLPPHEGGQ